MSDILTATRKWLRTCPLIDKNNRFNINYLGAQSVEYTLTLSGESHREDICGGDIATYNLLFLARMPFGAAMATNISAAELLGDLSEWVRAQNRAKAYPKFKGYEATRITPANSGVIIAAEANTAEYQLQLQLTLEEVY